MNRRLRKAGPYAETGLRKAPVMLLLAALSSTAAAADWALVGKTDVSDLYANPYMPRQGDVVSMWNLSDFHASKRFSTSGPTFSAIIRQEEFHCKEERMRTLYLEFNTRNMGRGDVVYSRGTPGGTTGEWTRVGPSPGASGPRPTDRHYFEIACTKR